ncbi:MAG: hypothetical protein KDB27_21600 [Planctomycetales bacterium]|nr:hypothetical protein [Planctomycetales bacterium]
MTYTKTLPLAKHIRSGQPKPARDSYYSSAVDSIVAQAELLRDAGYVGESYATLDLAVRLLLRHLTRETKAEYRRNQFRIDVMVKTSRSQGRISRKLFQHLEGFEKRKATSEVLQASFEVLKKLRLETGH